ncbi:MAG TPA: thiamine pyrophosphate-binding protein [Candidatus Limnocylindrales bacterium]
MTARRVGDAIVEVLRSAGVDTVFGIPGIHTLPLYDALAGEPAIRHILTRHEQGAAFAADGYARVAGRPGVLTTTTGPGTFNTLAAFAEAWSDSSPIVLLAGQIDAALDGLGRGVLHETPDQGRSFEMVTAYVGRPRTPDALPTAVAEALCRSMAGRPRPAYVEMPTDIVGAPFDGPTPVVEMPGRVAPSPDSIVAGARLLAGARRIVIMPGAGVHRAGASSELRELAVRLGAPVATAVTGAGSIPADDEWSAGVVIPGRPEWTELFAAADAVLVIGSRLDDVGTARWTLPLPNLVHIDVDPGVVGRAYPAAVGIVGDAKLALRGLLDELGAGPSDRDGADPDWGTGRAQATRAAVEAGVAPDQRAVRDAFVAARAAMPRDAILTHDAARVNSWSGFFWPIYEPDGSIWPWGSATLGFALGTANGAALAAPGRRVVATCGDGGFLFTAMELATTAAYGLDVTVLVHDDAAFGSIAAYQVRNHGRAYATELHNPDLVAFVRSFGIPAERVTDIAELPAAMGRATAGSGPSVVVLGTPLGQPWS